HEPVARHVDEVFELHGDAQARMLERDVRDERVRRVLQLALPCRVVEPCELAVDEEARVARVAHRLVGIADAREVKVPDRVVGVEAYEHIAVADDDAPWHFGLNRSFSSDASLAVNRPGSRIWPAGGAAARSPTAPSVSPHAPRSCPSGCSTTWSCTSSPTWSTATTAPGSTSWRTATP